MRGWGFERRVIGPVPDARRPGKAWVPFLGIEEDVGLLGCGGEVPGVRVQVAAGGFDGLVPQDALQHVQRNARVGEPCRAGVSEPVPGEGRQAQAGDEVVPFGRVAHARCGQDAAAGSAQQAFVWLAVLCEAFQDRLECIQDGDGTCGPSLGLFSDEPAGAGVGLSFDGDDVRVPVDVAARGPATSGPRAASSALSMAKSA